MNIKRLWNTCLLLLPLMAWGQQHIIFHNNFIQGADKPIPLMITSSNTKYTTSNIPWYHIPYNPFGAMVVLGGDTELDVHAFIRKDSLAYYRYSLVVNDTNLIIHNERLTGTISEANSYPSSHFETVGLFPYLPRPDEHHMYVKINLRIADVRQKKVTIKIYRLPRILEETTLIIYNKPLYYAEIVRPSVVIKDYKPVELGIKNTGLNWTQKVYLFRKIKGGYRFITEIPNKWTSYGDVVKMKIFYTLWEDLGAGSYEIAVSPFMYISRENLGTLPAASRFSFEIPPPPTSYSTKELLQLAAVSLVIMSAVVALIIYFINKRNRNRLMAANAVMEHTAVELTYIRSQLNPHFVFNALSGIQYLINGNQVEMANNYLSRFANLTRHILTDKSLISIKEEISILDDYLAMESLRFSFSFSISIDETENLSNIEIPVMLLQPLAENAVKHGVSGLKQEGYIQIRFARVERDLVIVVSDNGSGFDKEQEHKGFGLKLTNERIVLLNRFYKDCPISLDLYREKQRTIAKITLTNWL